MPADIFARDFKAEPYWWDDAAPQTRTSPLPGQADLVIVGGGFCGLGAARRALELGAKPVVLDAGAIAGGASSRSGAMLSAGQKFLLNGTSEQLGADLIEALTAAHAEAFDHVRALAAAYGAPGELFQPSGRLFLAAVPKDLDRFAGHARILSDLAGLTASVLGPQDLQREIHTRHYHGGLLVEDFGGLYPSRFACALLKDVEGRGAIVRSHTAVSTVRRAGDGFIVRTPAGDIRTPHVLFATNAYTDSAQTWVRQRVAQVGSYMIATEAIGREAVSALMPTRRMYSDTKRNLWYFRPSPDGTRILFGARPGLIPGVPERAAPLLHRSLAQIFPSLAGVKVSHAWTGSVAMTRSHLQHLGQREGCWFAVGCNGSGVGIMPWLGRLAVERMLGARATPTVFERLPFGRLPNLAGRPWYVPAAAGAFGLMDWLDRRQAGL